MEEGKKQEVNGVDYLIKQGYKKLSTKTFISDVELEQFLNKDFSNINKTRALGFIQILEREYPVDLSDLRADYLSYESSHKPKEPETLFTEKPIANDKEWQKYLPYIAGALAIFALAFYLFRPSIGIESIESPEPLVTQLEENKSAIDKAQENIKELESKKIIENTLHSSVTEETNTSMVSDTNANDDLDLDKVVLQMMKERNITAPEFNATQELNESQKPQKVQEQNATKPIAEKTEAKTKKVEPIAAVSTIKKETKNETKKEIKKEIKKEKTTKRELYIKPIQKAWVGVIYLDNFTKKDFLIRTKLPLDAKRDQLIIVGHGQFKIYNRAYSVKFRGKGPVRFIYRDGELMEISKKEFIRTSAGVGW